MERFFTNKRIWKMLIVAFLVIMAVQMIAPTIVTFAVEDDNVSVGGVLARPIASLLTTIGDGAVYVLHRFIMGQEVSTIHVTSNDDDSILSLALFNARKIVANISGFVGGVASFVPGVNVISGPLMKLSEVAMPNDLYLPVYTYTPEEIFKGNILLFNVNFFNTNKYKVMVNYSTWVPAAQQTVTVGSTGGNQEVVDTTPADKGEWSEAGSISKESFDSKVENGESVKANYYYYIDSTGKEIKTSPQDSAKILKNVISQWYVIIRDICIVAMLSVLVYIGIRMMLTSVASDKAKYKEMIKDWIVGLCLLFTMHYIMAFSNILVEKFTEIINSGSSGELVTFPLKDEYNGNLKKVAEELGLTESGYWKEEDGVEWFYYPTNLMGRLRLELQISDDGGQWLGLVICYLVLIIFTIMFTFSYLRRLLYMAFLTLIAPFVALTYCIDKVNDGQAQGFNTWLKEYIFNLLIQPMHLLLYFILVSSVFDLAKENIIYSLAALAFMIPAEKLLRTLFGFEKAKTPPLLGGPVGTALMMQGMNMMKGIAGRGGKNGTSASQGANGNINANSTDTSNRLKPVNTFDTLAANSDGQDNVSEMEHEAERPTRSREEIQSDIDALDALEQDMNNEDNLNYLIAERNKLDNEMARLNAQEVQPERTEPIRQVTIPGTDTSEEDSETASNQGRRIDRLASTAGNAISRRAKATGAAAKVVIKNAPKKIGSGAWKATKGIVAGGIVGGVATGIGVASAIASGEERNFVTGVGAGLGTGYTVGRRIMNGGIGGVASSHISAETRAAFDEVYHGEEYQKQDVEKASKEARKNQMNRLKAEQRLNSSGDRDAAKRFLEDNGDFDKMIQRGVTDIDRAIALEQGINEGVFNGIDDAVAHSQLYDNFGGKNPETMGAKDKENFNKTINNGLTERGIDERTATRRTDEIRGKVSYLHKKLH